MNFKKLKRMLSIVLSASMLLSTNMTGFAAEMVASTATESAAEQDDLQLDAEMRKATADDAGITRYTADNGSVVYGTSVLSNEAITLSPTEMSLIAGSQTKNTGILTATVAETSEGSGEYPKVTWIPDNPAIATVENTAGTGDPTAEQTATVTAVARGTTTITAQIGTGNDAQTATCTITVTGAITLSPETLTLSVGGASGNITAALSEGVADAEITWESSASDVAALTELEAGSDPKTATVKPLKVGTATITAKLGTDSDAPSATCEVTAGAHKHTYEYKKRVAATCWAAGMRAHYECSCGECFLTDGGDPIDKETLTKTLELPKLVHEPVRVAAHHDTPKNCRTYIPEYFECESCDRKYLSEETFWKGATEKGKPLGEEGGTWVTDPNEFKNTNGHTFETPSVDWSNLNEDETIYDEKTGISTNSGATVTRRCTDKNCEYYQDLDISVKRTKTFSDCEDGGRIAYEATVTTKKGVNEETLASPVEVTVKNDEKIVEIPVQSHKYEVKVNWDAFKPSSDANNKLINYNNDQKLVTAERICSVCNHKDESVKYDVTVTLADSEAFDPENNTLKCGVENTFNFVATVREAGTSTPVTVVNPTTQKNVNASKHDLELVAGKPATCGEDGNEAYYRCKRQDCRKEFWDDKGEDPVKKQSDVVIKARGHAFDVKFEFDNPALGGPVHATVKCPSCDAEVVFWDLKAADKGEYLGEEPKTCGERADISYLSGVSFDRKAIKKVNGVYEYVEEEATNEILREGYAVRSMQLEHDFRPTITWNDTNSTVDSSDTKHHNMDAGLTVTLRCSRSCVQAPVTLTATKKAEGGWGGQLLADPDNGALASGTIKVEALKDPESGYKEATCYAAGQEVYKVTVIIDTNNAIKPGMNTQYTVTEIINNPVPQLTHDYKVHKITWSKAQDENKVPKDVEAELRCQHCGDSLKKSDDTHTIAVTTAKDTTAASGFKAAKCMTKGEDAWKVTVTLDGTPVAFESGRSPFITKETPALGHHYADTPDNWDWSQYGTTDPSNPSRLLLNENLNEETAVVLAGYTCTTQYEDGTSACDGEPDPQAPGKKVGGKWMKQTAVKPTAGDTKADCMTAATIPYTAEISEKTGDQDTQEFYARATGHKWQQDVKWTWEDTGTKEATGENEGAPIYKVTASVVCRNTRCSIKQGVNNATENNTLTATINTDKKLVDKNHSYIETTVKHKEASCIESGRTDYTAKVVFVDEKGIVTTLTPGIDTSTKTVQVAKSGHRYYTVWDWNGIALDQNGKEKKVTVHNQTEADEKGLIRIESATAKTYCRNEENAEGYKPITQTFTDLVPKYDGATEPSCTEAVIAEYSLQPQTGESGRLVVTIPALPHKIQWNINVPLEDIDDSTTGVLAWKGCPYEIPDDVWTNDKYAQDRIPVSLKEAEDTRKPNCEDGGHLVWDLIADNEVIGSVSKDVGPVKGSHKINVLWNTLEAQKRDKDGKVTFKVMGDLTCAFDETHDAKVELEAVADLGAYDCKNPPQGKVRYQLTIKKVGATDWTEELAEENADRIEIVKGTAQDLDFTATSHVTRAIDASLSEDCSKASYKAHYRCNNCGKNFTTKSATREADVSLEPQGHQYGDPVYKWSGDGQVEAVFECTRSECPAKRSNPEDEETVVPEKPGNIRVFMAQITGGPYPGKTPTCQETGTEYYDTRVVLPEGEATGEFTDSEFEGDIVSDVPTVDHRFTGEGGKCEWCENTSGKVVKAAFYGRTGSLLESKWFDKNKKPVITDIPVAPNQVGYTFEGYIINNETGRVIQNRDALTAAIQTAFGTAGSDGIRVDLKYNQSVEKGAVNTHFISGTVQSPTELRTMDPASNLPIRTNHPVTAPATIDKDGKTYYFSHWADKDGKTLATSTRYEVYIDKAGTKDVYAVYVADQAPEVENVPSVASTSTYTTTTIEGVKKITFTFTMSDLGLYEGCEFVDSGILYAKNTDEAAAAGMTYENSSKVVLNGKKTNTLTVKVPEAEVTHKIAAKGYLRYKIGQEVFIVYSDAVVKSYNTLKAEEDAQQ